MIINKTLIASPLYSKQALNAFNTLQLFSSDTLNYRVPLIDPFTNKPTDQYIFRYSNHMFSAYMQKRKIKRSQIWPKIHVLEDPPLNEQPHIKCQKLFQVKRLLDQNLMKRIVKQDPTQINSTFIISMFSEDHFKQLIDQYVGKTLVCGKAPSVQSEQKMIQLQKKVIDLYRNFYFGERITPLQRQIERYYLGAKQQKAQRRKAVPKNQYFRCTWRQQDQRLIQDMVNWAQADINLSDLSYRPYYERLTISSRLPYVQKYTNLIGGSNFFTRWVFNNSIKKQYTYSQPYLKWIKNIMFSRVIQYSKCLQFTQNMNIPPDFMIEMSIINIHIWLLTDRLRQINTKKTLNLARMLDRMFYEYFDNLIGSLNVKKLSITRRRLQEILAVNRNNLNMHFNGYQKTKENPYLFIDALVWSVAFRGKTERYCNEVYKFSEYLIKNRQHLKIFDQQDFLDATCQFDCYLIDPDYKQKIIQINPPMSKQQFEQQFKSNKDDKKYYYRTNTQHLDYTIQLKQPKIQAQRFSFTRSLIEKIINFSKKYLTTLERYDHYTQMDQQKKEAQIKDKKSPWKSETDRLAEVDQEMTSINQIRRERSRRKESSNIQSAQLPKDTQSNQSKPQQPKKKE